MALSEEDIDRLADAIVHGAEERYVTELTASLADRMADGLSAASAEQLLQLARECQAEARRLLAEHGPRIEEEARRLVERAIGESDAADSAALAAAYGPAAATAAAAGVSAHFAEIAWQTAKGVAEIIARQNVAMAESAAKLWYEVAGEAVTAVNHGLKPRAEVLAEAVAKLAGIDRIEYASGVRNRIDVAVRRHVVTQASQAGGRMTLERMRAYGHELVVTSAHYGARPSHAAWQGLPARIGGPGTVGGRRYPGLVELTGYGTVGGLKGANCRHSINPYFPGTTELPKREWPEHEKRFGMTSAEYYEATQRQRELERRIRDAKREIACMERAGIGFESPTYVQKRLLLGRRQAAIRKHCADKGLVRLYEREKAYGVASQPRALRSYAYWSGGKRRSYSLSSIASFEKKYRGTTGREIGMVFDKDGKDLLLLEGEGHHIRFEKPPGRRWDELHFAHTHPNEYGGTFSMDDIYFFCDSGALSLRAVCNEGTYLIERGDGAKPRSFMRAYDKAFIEASAEVAGRRELAERIHGWLSENAKLYGFRYDLESVGVK